MTVLLRWSLGAVSLCVLLAACGSGVGEPGPGETDDIFSERAPVVPSGGMGGAGGAGGDSGVFDGALVFCTPEVVVEPDPKTGSDAPECFAAEVYSTVSPSCDTAGREVLSSARENAVRTTECGVRGLSDAKCEALTICGLEKLSGTAASACRKLDGSAPTGFCLGTPTSTCEASAVDAIYTSGVSPEADSVHVYCAVR